MSDSQAVYLLHGERQEGAGVVGGEEDTCTRRLRLSVSRGVEKEEEDFCCGCDLDGVPGALELAPLCVLPVERVGVGGGRELCVRACVSLCVSLSLSLSLLRETNTCVCKRY